MNESERIDAFHEYVDNLTTDQVPHYLHVYQQLVFEINDFNGWFEDDRRFGEDIALLHSEVSEMLEAYRDGGTDDQTEPGPHGKNKPEGVGSEAADVLIRLLDTCHRHNIDLDFEMKRKLKYNSTRGNRHGGKKL